MIDKKRALTFNILAVTCWAIAPAMMHSVKDYFSVNFQNMFRYLVSLGFLWPYFFFSLGREKSFESIRKLLGMFPRILGIALVNYFFQISYTLGVFKLLPGIFTLIIQSQIMFSVFLAMIFFADERRTLKNPVFITGMIAAIIGVVLTITGGRELGKVEFNIGVIVTLVSAGCWAMVGALIKKWLPSIPPALSVTSVLTVVTPLFFLTYILAQGGLHIPSVPLSGWILMLLSGLIGVGLGQSFYYRAVPVLGIALASSIGLLTPFIASLVSYIVFGERMTIIQILGGFFLISGSYLVIRIRFSHI